MGIDVSFAFPPPGGSAYLSRRLSLATSLKGRGLRSSGCRYENTVGPLCQGTLWSTSARVRRKRLCNGKKKARFGGVGYVPGSPVRTRTGPRMGRLGEPSEALTEVPNRRPSGRPACAMRGRRAGSPGTPDFETLTDHPVIDTLVSMREDMAIKWLYTAKCVRAALGT